MKTAAHLAQRWVTDNGVIESRQALAYPGRPDRAVILRRVSAVDSEAHLSAFVALAGDYGRRPVGAGDVTTLAVRGRPRLTKSTPDGAEPLTQTCRESRRTSHLMWNSTWTRATPMISCWSCSAPRSRSATGPTPTSCGAKRPRVGPRVFRNARTPAGRDVRRSFATLRGLTETDGATVAAVTTALPERAEAGRNYDYRYGWIRDICYIGQAGAAIDGGEPVLDDAVRWVCARILSDGVSTTPAYRGDGSPVPEPLSLGLAGYPGGSDVVGNRVRDQFQLDLFGEVLLLLANAASQDRLDTHGWDAAELAIRAIAEVRRERPRIWEIGPDYWTHSRLICAAGLRAIAEHAPTSRRVTTSLSLADHLLSAADRTPCILRAVGSDHRAMCASTPLFCFPKFAGPSPRTIPAQCHSPGGHRRVV